MPVQATLSIPSVTAPVIDVPLILIIWPAAVSRFSVTAPEMRKVCLVTLAIVSA